MTSFVLLGGAWHGAWCWKYVTPKLRDAGFGAYPLSLTGLGAYRDRFTSEAGLSTHIQGVTSLPSYEVLHNVILIDHSYTGEAISGDMGAILTEPAAVTLVDLAFTVFTPAAVGR